MHHCMQESLICIRALKLNFPSYQWIAQEHGKLYYIYRDDYSEAGRRICKELEKFGGPKCAATASEAWRSGCAYAKSLGKFPGELDRSECYRCKGIEACAGGGV